MTVLGWILLLGYISILLFLSHLQREIDALKMRIHGTYRGEQEDDAQQDRGSREK